LIEKKIALHLLLAHDRSTTREEGKNLHEGALAKRMTEQAGGTRTVYDYPVAGHLCTDGIVRYIKLVRRQGNQPQGTCTQCQISFHYVKPKPSSVRHPEGDGATHF
jgi:hypothetical protein